MTQEKREKRLIRMADLTHIFHVGQKVRVFVADDIWQKWHKGTVKETHEDYILVDVPDICDHMQYENDYPMRRKTPCFSYGDIRRVHRIYASN